VKRRRYKKNVKTTLQKKRKILVTFATVVDIPTCPTATQTLPSSYVAQPRPEQTRTDQNRPEQTRTDQNRPEQTRTDQNRSNKEMGRFTDRQTDSYMDK
jgi:hypothetical protein